MSRLRAIGLLIATALLFSLSGALVKLIHWDSLAIAGARGGIAALVSLALTRISPRMDGSRAQIGAIVGWVVTSFSLVLAMRSGAAANAIALMFSAPLYTAFLGHWFLGERLRRRDIVTLLAVLLGIVLLFLDQLTTTGIWANIFGVLSGVGFAVYVVCLRAQRNDGALHTTFFGNVLVALFGLPVGIGTLPPPAEWFALLALGVLTLGLPSVFFALAIPRVTALESVLILVLEPVFLPVWVAVTVGELPGPWAMFGGLLIVVAITLRGIMAARDGAD